MSSLHKFSSSWFLKAIRFVFDTRQHHPLTIGDCPLNPIHLFLSIIVHYESRISRFALDVITGIEEIHSERSPFGRGSLIDCELQPILVWPSHGQKSSFNSWLCLFQHLRIRRWVLHFNMAMQTLERLQVNLTALRRSLKKHALFKIFSLCEGIIVHLRSITGASPLVRREPNGLSVCSRKTYHQVPFLQGLSSYRNASP